MKPWHDHLHGLNHYHRSIELYDTVTTGVKTADVGFAHVFSDYHHSSIKEARRNAPKNFPVYLISDDIKYTQGGLQVVKIDSLFTATQKYVDPKQVAFYLKQDPQEWKPVDLCQFHHWTLVINGHHRFAAAFIRGDREIWADVDRAIPFSGKLPRFWGR